MRKEATRARLLESAVRLFAARGYDETSVDDVAAAADVARQTFFNHFPGKEDVVRSWVRSRDVEVATALQDAPGNHATTRISRGLLTVASLYDADAATSRPLVRHWVRIGGPVLPTAGSMAEPLRVIVEQGQRDGQLRADVPAEVAARTLLDVYRGALYRWSSGDEDLHPLMGPPVRLVLTSLRVERAASATS